MNRGFCSNTKILLALMLIWTMALPISEAKSDSNGRKGSTCLTGAYLIKEGSGTRGVWTFTGDGNFIGTSSAQPLLNFSTLQGVWKQTDWKRAQATVLDFTVDDQGNLINIARVDILIETDRKFCNTIEGEFSLRFFEEGEDPMKPETDTGSPITDIFTGERITAP